MTIDAAAMKDFRASLTRLGDGDAKQELPAAEIVRRAKATFIGRLDRQMAVDLETCIHCGMCAEACHFYEATGDKHYAPIYKLDPLRRVYRRELSPMRWFFRPFTKEITAPELKEWQPLVYEACTGCGRCDMMCPMGISISRMIRVVREGLADAGLMPAELQALDDEQRDSGTIFGVGPDQLRARIESMRQQGSEIPLDREKADVLVLTTAVEVLLFDGTLKATAEIMNNLKLNWTILSNAFEAGNVGLLAGDDKAQREATARIVAGAKQIGAKTVVVPETGHAYQALRWEAANELGEALPFEVLSLSEFIAREVAASRLVLKAAADGHSVTYHDPCRLGRHSGVYEEPRDVLQALGYELRETASNRRENYCCGGGCAEYVVRRSQPLRQKAFEIKQREFDDTEADAVVTTCANCRINLMTGADQAGWSRPIESLAELVAANLAD
jgi:Fe-S oxidoreductase